MQYSIIRSKRKTAAIYVDRDLCVKVRAPLKMREKDIHDFVNKNTLWIEKQLQKHRENKSKAIILSPQQIDLLKDRAKETLSQKTREFSSIMNVKPTRVKITSAKCRWGSCSYDNAICYSYRVMLLDEECQDYIVVHELSHIKHKNHSAMFYKEIENVLPDYRKTVEKIKNFSNPDLYIG
ncbi:MAG: SprT family zinc-dependent metalloprotease [Oscillospiraceae bacterium]